MKSQSVENDLKTFYQIQEQQNGEPASTFFNAHMEQAV